MAGISDRAGAPSERPPSLPPSLMCRYVRNVAVAAHAHHPVRLPVSVCPRCARPLVCLSHFDARPCIYLHVCLSVCVHGFISQAARAYERARLCGLPSVFYSVHIMDMMDGWIRFI